MAERRSTRGRRSLVSSTSVLLLSGFLVMTAASETGDDLRPYVLASGLVGVLAWIGLELARERHQRTALADREADACRRLHRHLTTPLSPVPLDFDRDPVADVFASSSPTGQRGDLSRPSSDESAASQAG